MSIDKTQLDVPFTRNSKSRGDTSAQITGFYEPDTGSCQYVCADPLSRKAALIDVVLNFDPASASTSTKAAQQILDFVESEQLEVEWILDTHPHADHFTASSWLKEKLGAPAGIGEKATEIAKLWETIYNRPGCFDPAAEFDRLFADGDTFKIGSLDVRVMLSPGHTLGSVTYVVGSDAAFVHDTFMQPDSGTSRADFPGGSANSLYNSLQSILSLPEKTRLFVGHDYGTQTRDLPAWESNVAEQKSDNIHVGGNVSRETYVKLREDRDETLGLPNRMLYALQVNLRGGRLPEPERDGHSYFRIPANRF